MRRGARLADFVRMRAFFHARVFRVGAAPPDAPPADPRAALQELHDFVLRKVVRPFQDDEYYRKNREKFDGIFRMRNKNLVSVAETIERRNPALRGALDPSVLTRGFVKALEMYQFMARRRMLRRNTGESLKAFHLSELPGGFFLAFRHFCHLHDVPAANALHSLKQSEKYPHAFPDLFNLGRLDAIDYGREHGDLSKRREVEHFKKRYANMDLVTADFGYMLGDQTPNATYEKIFLHELEIAKTILHPRGAFVMKVYLLLNEQNLRMIYAVYREFGELHFYKPLFSRFHSFEIYLIARRTDAPRLTFDEFLRNTLPFLQRVVWKIHSMYSLFVYMYSYGPVSQEDVRAIRRLKRNLSDEIAALFEPGPVTL